MKNNELLKLNGSRYDPTVPGLLREYAKTNPYINAASSYAIAEIFGVTRQTVCNWLKEHPEFRDAVRGLRAHQLNRVESAMMKRVFGYTVTERKTVRTADGPVEHTVEKEIPPDAALIRYYLEHRCPSRWGEQGGSTDAADKLLDAEDRPEDLA